MRFIGWGLAAALLLTCGCDKPAQGGGATSGQGGSAKAHDDHDHDHDHDHGHDHDHHKAPHGGVLVELGEHAASVEIVFDAAAGRLTLYAFDGCAENAARLKQDAVVVRLKTVGKDAQELSLAARENALTGEKPGDSSEFSNLDDALKGAASLDGTIAKIEIKGQTYTDVKFAWPKSGG